MTALAATLDELAAAIRARAEAGAAAESYTAQLLGGDGERLMKKIIEEAGEVSLAAAAGKRERVAEELADLWYHCLVLMRRHDLSLDDLSRALARRRGQSGLAEKQARKMQNAQKAQQA